MAHFVYTGLKANLPEVRENAFYLCTDTREIYFGADLFTEAVRTYTGEKPATPATGVLYVNTDTKVGEIWTGSAWVQLFGGSSTDDIVFTEDLVFTYQFGKYTPIGGKVTVPAKDKTLTELLNDAFAEDQNPTVTQPSVTLTAAKIKAYEVGTKVSPDYSAVLNPGSYEFEPKATGIVASAWKVTNTDGGEKTTASGTLTRFRSETTRLILSLQRRLMRTALCRRLHLARITPQARSKPVQSLQQRARFPAIVIASMAL